uniref:Uncharacterized protein n=1 Tax=Romanomermis culicivorax TaxID=13658 RepID=A0A915K0F7_ROMCU
MTNSENRHGSSKKTKWGKNLLFLHLYPLRAGQSLVTATLFPHSPISAHHVQQKCALRHAKKRRNKYLFKNQNFAFRFPEYSRIQNLRETRANAPLTAVA